VQRPDKCRICPLPSTLGGQPVLPTNPHRSGHEGSFMQWICWSLVFSAPKPVECRHINGTIYFYSEELRLLTTDDRLFNFSITTLPSNPLLLHNSLCVSNCIFD
jgi:hypothetical protein